MTKLQAPLFSLTARGNVSKGLYYSKRRSGHTAARLTPPTDPHSADQMSRRGWFQQCVATWHSLSPTERAYYTAAARATRQASGYLVFMREWLVGLVPDHAPNHTEGGSDPVTLTADQINLGRFGMPRMPDMALNKIMLGQGPSIDPVEIDLPASGEMQIFYHPGNGYITGGATIGSPSAGEPAVYLPTTGFTGWQAIHQIPSGATSITSAKIYYTIDAALNNVRLILDFKLLPNTPSIAKTGDSETGTYAAGGSPTNRVGIIAINDIAFSGITIVENYMLGIRINRDGDHAADTYTATLSIHGIEVKFN